MQIVYLSNRPEVLAGTLDAVGRFMPWVDDVVVCAPARQHRTVEASAGRPVTLLDDAAVTGLTPATLADLDHVSRNVTLRRAMLDGGHLADTFLLSDDDYRPLVDIPRTDFETDDGRHTGYYFYDLARWPGDETPYDRAQIRTLAVLRLLDRPTLAYGAHMPQIMRAEWLAEAFALADAVDAGPVVDEWSLYFDIAATEHPDGFTEPRPFRTLAWPQWPHQWPHWVPPGPIRFENHHPEHEQPGGLFHGLGPVHHPADAMARIERWRQAEVAIAELRFDPAWIDPWTRGRPHRRAALTTLRWWRRARRIPFRADPD